ncbi:MAG: serine/threonine-protein kinase, partial [Myxococcota bacterium]|nr:serine/threonine-protein kinase [Myxococcota bacterium]
MEEQPTLIPGYRIVRTIGAGGMGIVCEAEKLATHETFALKVMHQHLAADPAHAARFEREVNALRAIRHPNVIDIYEWSFSPVGSGEASFVVMELLEGETLQQLLRREGLLPPRRAVAFMLQVLDGLAAAHRVGVLHRDLAPSNVFLAARADGKPRVKILDFGLARSILGEEGSAAVTQPGTVMGKPAFAPPELFHEQPVGEADDIFGCGMI